MRPKNVKKQAIPWTDEWYGYTEEERDDVIWESQVHTTESICEQAMNDLNHLFDNEDEEPLIDDLSQNNIPSLSEDPEAVINDIIDAIHFSNGPQKTFTKRDLEDFYKSGAKEPISMQVRIEEVDKVPKMMDGGSNRNITDRKEILRRYRKLLHKIPVSGVAAGGPACYIEGYGYIDLVTEEGHNLEILVYYSPQCASTILSPNAIVSDSKGKYTGWMQCGHMDLKKGYVRFFNRRHKNTTSTIPTSSSNKLWYITQDKSDMMRKAGSKTEMYYERKYDRAYANAISVSAQYELWHQRCLHPGKTVMEYLPLCVEGVPAKLSTLKNHFQKCGSCMPAKVTKPSGNPTERPKTKVSGERFHFDFGFIRSEENQAAGLKDKIIRSWDGYNSYLIAVDKHTRYTWIFLSKTKDPPLDTVDKFLDMHGIPNEPEKERGLIKVIKTDGGGELAGCKEFEKLCNEKGYSLEHTAADSSSQNGIAERPNETLGNMLRATMHSSGIDGKYWSDVLLQVVFIKNKLPHAHFKFKSTPQTEFTGIRPNLASIRTPGSLVTVKKPGRRPARLANHAYDGVFLRYDNTLENCVYVDRRTKMVKHGRIDTFDEAHYSTAKRPPGPQQLYNLGIRKERTVHQEPIPIHIHEDVQNPSLGEIVKNKPSKKLLVQLTHEDAVPPVRSTAGAAGYDLCSCEDIIIEPGGVGCIDLGLSIQLPEGTYGRIAPRSGLAFKKNEDGMKPYLDVKAGVIDEDYRGSLKVILHNLHDTPATISKRTRIAQLILERIETPKSFC